jgi:hypothetical protein
MLPRGRRVESLGPAASFRIGPVGSSSSMRTPSFPVAMNPGLARAIGTMLKQDFQRAVLNRIPQMSAEPRIPARPVLFLCDEYQAFATTGENEPSGDEKFFSLARQARCTPLLQRRASARFARRSPASRGGRCCKAFAPRSFCHSPMTSVGVWRRPCAGKPNGSKPAIPWPKRAKTRTSAC